MTDQERQARANIDPQTLRDIERVCGTNDLRDIVRDGSVQSPSSMIPEDLTAERRWQSTSGFVEPSPIRPPPGIDLIDKLCEAQDRRDRLPDQQQAQFMMAMQMMMQVTSQTQAIAKLLLEQHKP
jgi:hypothetical protein